MPSEDFIRQAVAASIRAKQEFFAENSARVLAVGQRLAAALRAGHKVLLFGNGGSAADAQHIAAELVNRFACERQALAAIALTTDTSILTSVANDTSYDEVFARQIDALGRAGDIAIAISTSGNAASVLCAAARARSRGMTVIALTGKGGGKLKALADEMLIVPSEDTARIQEVHILIGHLLCGIVEREISQD